MTNYVTNLPLISLKVKDGGPRLFYSTENSLMLRGHKDKKANLCTVLESPF